MDLPQYKYMQSTPFKLRANLELRNAPNLYEWVSNNDSFNFPTNVSGIEK